MNTLKAWFLSRSFRIMEDTFSILVTKLLLITALINGRTIVAQIDSLDKGNISAQVFQERQTDENVGNIKTIILDEGRSLKLECVFSGQSWMQIQWVKAYFTAESKQTVKVIPSQQYPTNGSSIFSEILLSDVVKDDSGIYSCISITTMGSTALEFDVSIKEKLFCKEIVCENNGTCEELPDRYLCNCSPGFIGAHCEDPDPCFSAPCENNGTCVHSNKGEFTCDCARGYKGNLCQSKVCLPTSCSGAGNCSETDEGNIRCGCPSDRAGDHCQHQCTFSRRTGRNCHYYTGITCVWYEDIFRGSYETCECHDYDSNKYCMASTDVQNECTDPEACNGRGRCRDRKYKYTCSCQSYSSGKFCELYNECSARVENCSEYGGTCVDERIGYSCRCPTNQYGEYCQFSNKPCSVTCNDQSFRVNCDMRFLNEKIQRMVIKSNPGPKQCDFSGSISTQSYYLRDSYGNRRTKYRKRFSATIQYTDCETETKLYDDFILFKNSIRAGDFDPHENSSSVISRRAGHFKFDMQCKQPILKASSKQISSISLNLNESSEYSVNGSISTSTRVTYYNFHWTPIQNYAVGDRIFVRLQLTQQTSNPMFKFFKIIPRNCFATPASDLKTPRYDLLKNGCIKDETFRYEKVPKTDRSWSYPPSEYFSFDSFKFVGGYDKLFLQCDVKICLNFTSIAFKNDWASCQSICDQDKKLNTDQDESHVNISTTTQTVVQELSREKRDLGMIGRIRNALFGNSIIERTVGQSITLDSGF